MKVRNHYIINFYAAYNNTFFTSARKHTYLTIMDKVRLIKASAGKSHCQLAVESDDDDPSDTLSVIKKYPFYETMEAVSVLKDFTADRCPDDIPHSMFNIEDKLQDFHVKIKSTGQQSFYQFIFPTAVSCPVTFILKIICFYKNI